MVRMLVSLLAYEGDRKTAPDNPEYVYQPHTDTDDTAIQTRVLVPGCLLPLWCLSYFPSLRSCMLSKTMVQPCPTVLCFVLIDRIKNCFEVHVGKKIVERVV